MHGLIFWTVQAFVTDGFGATRWAEVTTRADLGFEGFEAMLPYEPALLPRVLDACAEVLDRPQAALLEDLGGYLVTHPNNEAIRRLMRFGGLDFIEFLHSLDDLPDRTRLALQGLDLPEITLRDHRSHVFTLECRGEPSGFGHVLVGLLQGMADDYGALAVISHLGMRGGTEIVEVSVVETAFAEGRGFDLGRGADGVAG